MRFDLTDLTNKRQTKITFDEKQRRGENLRGGIRSLFRETAIDKFVQRDINGEINRNRAPEIGLKVEMYRRL